MTSVMPFVMQERGPEAQMLLQVIASILEELVRKGEEQRRKQGDRAMTKFHGLRAPSIPLAAYLQRIAQFSGCSNESFILMLVYIDRLVTNKNIPLDALNVHRLVITGTLLAAKFFDDHYLDNSHYSAVGGLPRHELNELELEFLFLLGFNLFVTTDNFNTYYTTLTNMAKSRTAQQQPPLMAPNVNTNQATTSNNFNNNLKGSPDHQHQYQQQHQQGISRTSSDQDQWVHVSMPNNPGNEGIVVAGQEQPYQQSSHDESSYMIPVHRNPTNNMQQQQYTYGHAIHAPPPHQPKQQQYYEQSEYHYSQQQQVGGAYASPPYYHQYQQPHPQAADHHHNHHHQQQQQHQQTQQQHAPSSQPIPVVQHTTASSGPWCDSHPHHHHHGNGSAWA